MTLKPPESGALAPDCAAAAPNLGLAARNAPLVSKKFHVTIGCKHALIEAWETSRCSRSEGLAP